MFEDLRTLSVCSQIYFLYLVLCDGKTNVKAKKIYCCFLQHTHIFRMLHCMCALFHAVLISPFLFLPTDNSSPSLPLSWSDHFSSSHYICHRKEQTENLYLILLLVLTHKISRTFTHTCTYKYAMSIQHCNMHYKITSYKH